MRRRPKLLHTLFSQPCIRHLIAVRPRACNECSAWVEASALRCLAAFARCIRLLQLRTWAAASWPALTSPLPSHLVGGRGSSCRVFLPIGFCSRVHQESLLKAT